MHQRGFSKCWVAAACWCAATAAGAADTLIATVPFARSLGVHAILTEGHMQLCAGLPEGCNSSARLDLPAMGNGAQGTTVWSDATTANFSGYVGYVTNGAKDPHMAMFRIGGGAALADFEPQFFGSQVGPNGVDLGGFIIHRIGYRIDSLSIVSPGSDADHDGVWTDAQVSGAYLYEGTCSQPPQIAVLPARTVAICGVSATVELPAPAATSLCSHAPYVKGFVFLPPSAGVPTPIVEGKIILPLGRHFVFWTANDGYDTSASGQHVRLRKKAHGCPP